MSILNLPLVDPKRQTSGFRPFKALSHFRKLVADKEDTKQVFFIIEALKGRRSHRQAWDFIRSEQGQGLIAREEREALPDMLDDHARWASCAPGSLAQEYIAFMKREGLSANGLVAESYAWSPRESRPQDQTEWYFNRLRDTHDLFHVLTSYGRDALGEAALLGFGYEQNHNLGVKFIAYAGARQIKKTTGTRAPLYEAINEGRRLGRAARKLAHMDVEQVMPRDIEEVRTELNIGEPVLYRQCLAQLEAEGFCCEMLGLDAIKAQAASGQAQAAA